MTKEEILKREKSAERACEILEQIGFKATSQKEIDAINILSEAISNESPLLDKEELKDSFDKRFYRTGMTLAEMDEHRNFWEWLVSELPKLKQQPEPKKLSWEYAMKAKFKCRECGWIGTSLEMKTENSGDDYSDSCPKCGDVMISNAVYHCDSVPKVSPLVNTEELHKKISCFLLQKDADCDIDLYKDNDELAYEFINLISTYLQPKQGELIDKEKIEQLLKEMNKQPLTFVPAQSEWISEESEIIEKIKPYMYCFCGSEMLSNTYNDTVAENSAKECLKIIKEYLK